MPSFLRASNKNHVQSTTTSSRAVLQAAPTPSKSARDRIYCIQKLPHFWVPKEARTMHDHLLDTSGFYPNLEAFLTPHGPPDPDLVREASDSLIQRVWMEVICSHDQT